MKPLRGDLGLSAEWRRALQLLERMQNQGPKPNIITYNVTSAAIDWSLAKH